MVRYHQFADKLNVGVRHPFGYAPGRYPLSIGTVNIKNRKNICTYSLELEFLFCYSTEMDGVNVI